MALVANPKVEKLVSILKSNFAIIAKTAKTPVASSLLFDDMLAFGTAFAEMDPNGKHTETKLLADILAELNDDQKFIPYEHILTSIDAKIAQADKQPKRSLKEMAAFVANLQSVKLIAAAFQDEGDMHEPGYEAANAFIDLVDMYILRDGNISASELELIDMIEDFFAGEQE